MGSDNNDIMCARYMPARGKDCLPWLLPTITYYYLLLPTITYYLLPTITYYYLLPTTYYYLLPTITYYLLPITYYLLPTTYYLLLPTTYYYLLPITYYYLLLPTITYYYLLLPTITYYYLLSGLSEWKGDYTQYYAALCNAAYPNIPSQDPTKKCYRWCQSTGDEILAKKGQPRPILQWTSSYLTSHNACLTCSPCLAYGGPFWDKEQF